MPTKPHHQVELKYMESGLMGFKEKTKVANRFPPPPTSPYPSVVHVIQTSILQGTSWELVGLNQKKF